MELSTTAVEGYFPQNPDPSIVQAEISTGREARPANKRGSKAGL